MPTGSSRSLRGAASLEARIALTTACATGLRLSDVVGLNVADIDGKRGVIQIRHGKDGKRLPHASEDASGRPARLSSAGTRTRWLLPIHGRSGLINVTVLHAGCRCLAPPAVASIDKNGMVHAQADLLPLCWRRVSTSALSWGQLCHNHLSLHQGLTGSSGARQARSAG
ncbi:tyrosine-type recombinase/integrase [Mesorhizobium sp. M0663]|uniref:tyrosine-type recombinase/integrase n=1 Tax=Mesorhizobium sp. M0663 TaxID=2956981 RepID=UPI0033364AD5